MSSPSGESKSKTKYDVKTIGTHDGHFHCDEVLACYMLKLLPEYKDARILRTSNLTLLKQCDIVVDVGGEYNPATHRYDHHQSTFNDSMNSLTRGKKPWYTKLSSAGLVYLHFGHRVISAITGINPAKDKASLEEIYSKVYYNFVKVVDAADNYNTVPAGISRDQYQVQAVVLRASGLDPSWNAPIENSDGQFRLAMQLMEKEFTNRIMEYKNVWLPTRGIVQRALQS